MKNSTAALQQFLLNNYTRVYADLYTVTLLGGATLYWTSSDQPITWNASSQSASGGTTFICGPRIEDKGLNQKVGVNTDQLTVDFYYDDNTLISGSQMATFILNEGFDGAIIRVDRIWAASWIDMYGGAAVGSFIRFLGRYSAAQDVGETQATVVICSPEEVLDTSVPADLYSASCLNTFCDANCTLSAANYTTASSVKSGTITSQAFPTNVSGAAGVYNFGYVVFTSGVNKGVQRSVQTQDGSGNLTLIAPFPAAPAPGDTFNIVQGCDLQLSTCINKFNNKAHFRGQPFVPLPVAVVSGATTPGTSSGGKGGGTHTVIGRRA
jgi:uncharacterized phage protein (TIGR02218 family)